MNCLLSEYTENNRQLSPCASDDSNANIPLADSQLCASYIKALNQKLFWTDPYRRRWLLWQPMTQFLRLHGNRYLKFFKAPQGIYYSYKFLKDLETQPTMRIWVPGTLHKILDTLSVGSFTLSRLFNAAPSPVYYSLKHVLVSCVPENQNNELKNAIRGLSAQKYYSSLKLQVLKG